MHGRERLDELRRRREVPRPAEPQAPPAAHPPAALLALQRSAGNQAARSLLLRLSSAQTGTIAAGVANLETDYESLKSVYPIAQRIEGLARRGGVDADAVRELLHMAMAAHRNAPRLRTLVEGVAPEDRAEAVK